MYKLGHEEEGRGVGVGEGGGEGGGSFVGAPRLAS